jgi:hypothetical protein
LASAKFFERQAVALAALARETEDDDCRKRCLRLQQIYLHLAESEKSSGIPIVAGRGEDPHV